PGVQAAAAAQFVPYQGSYRSIPYLVEGLPDARRADRAMAISNVVTPRYFAAVGIELRSGRVLSAQACAESSATAVINETMARRHWPGGSAIGRRLYVGPRLDQAVTIAGVVRDTLGQTETDVVRPQVYLCAPQFPSRSMALIVRGADAA